MESLSLCDEHVKKSLIKHIKQSKYGNQEKRTQKDKSEELLKLNKLCTW